MNFPTDILSEITEFVYGRQEYIQMVYETLDKEFATLFMPCTTFNAFREWRNVDLSILDSDKREFQRIKSLDPRIVYQPNLSGPLKTLPNLNIKRWFFRRVRKVSILDALISDEVIGSFDAKDTAIFLASHDTKNFVKRRGCGRYIVKPNRDKMRRFFKRKLTMTNYTPQLFDLFMKIHKSKKFVHMRNIDLGHSISRPRPFHMFSVAFVALRRSYRSEQHTHAPPRKVCRSQDYVFCKKHPNFTDNDAVHGTFLTEDGKYDDVYVHRHRKWELHRSIARPITPFSDIPEKTCFRVWLCEDDSNFEKYRELDTHTHNIAGDFGDPEDHYREGSDFTNQLFP
jgi:hypothetical protein